MTNLREARQTAKRTPQVFNERVRDSFVVSDNSRSPMVCKRRQGDLNVAYRPYRMDEVFGNERIVRMFSNHITKKTLPHAMMFTGPAGCGKTTAARIVALGMNCETGHTPDPCCKCDSCTSTINLNSLAVLELDSTRSGNIDVVKSTLKDLGSSPLGGERYRILIIDEAHNLSGKAEDAFLKFLEDCPPHVYIILCTNEPQKLKLVTRQRCKTTQFGRLETHYIYDLIEQVAQFEGMTYKKDVLKKIAEASEGTPRQALTFLQMIAAEDSWEDEAVSMVLNYGVDIDQAEVYEFCKTLLKGSFKTSMNAYKKIKTVPAETVRINITGFFTGCLRNARSVEDARKYSQIIDIIKDPYYGPKPENILTNNIFKIAEVLR